MKENDRANYLEQIVDFFYTLPYASIDEATLHQIHRSFLDYCGCALYTGYHQCCDEIENFVISQSATGTHRIWGSDRRTTAAAAACINACRVSNIEMDDGSGINAAVHPGLYVWTGALTAYESHPCDPQSFAEAILFGYDLLMRVGMLSAKNVSALELHGPGLSGAMGTVAAAGMIMGLTRDEMLQALGIAGSLLPLCPFISFVKGVTVKDLYGGWGCYLGMLAVEMVISGMTGTREILDGDKSLKEFYNDERGKDVSFGAPYYINVIGFKEYPACLALHPALTAIESLLERENFESETIQHVCLHVSPSAYALSSGVEFPLSSTAARIYLPYAVSASLVEGRVHPDSFLPSSLQREAYAAMMERVEVQKEEEYDRKGVRACRAEITLRDGRALQAEAEGVRWCHSFVGDEALNRKFFMLTEGVVDVHTQHRWHDTIMGKDILAAVDMMLMELGKGHDRAKSY